MVGHITPENYNESNCGIELLMQIIVWAPSIGSIPIYDYSLGLRVQPPLYICVLNLLKNLLYYTNNVVDLVYNGS